MLNPQLDAFLQVAESGSLSRAATLRKCSTVSIMNQMNSFEERLGFKLLERSSHGISLTDAGKALYAEAKKLRGLADDILNRAWEISSGTLPVVRIGNSYLRPCKPLLDILQGCQAVWNVEFRLKIVSFNDEPDEFSDLRDRLGENVDCFVSPYDSVSWINNFGIHHLGYYRCCISVPAWHRLARKVQLTWDDMAGETLMLVTSGISPVIDQIRYEIGKHHPHIKLVDSPSFYDVETFNLCQQQGYLLETPEIWANIHPGFITIPVDWPYRLPFGLIYSKHPSQAFERFVKALNDCGSSKGKDQQLSEDT